VLAHNNLTEIDAALDLFWRAGVDASQVVIGVGFYGRSFTLADPECATAGCAWISGGDAGPCSKNAGTLMYSEIADIIDNNELEPQLDEVAGVESITWNGNQWVSFDDAYSFAIKMNYANDHCISGVMIWSVDQDTSDYFELDSL
jgi:GH18 family chitinase